MDSSQHRVAPILCPWAVCLAAFLTTADAGAAQADPTTPAQVESTGAADGPSLGAIIAGCLGVVFGAVIARWQIKALSNRK